MLLKPSYRIFFTAITIVATVSLTHPAYGQHPSIILRDTDGNPVYDTLSNVTINIVNSTGQNEQLKLGNPVSFERTCATGNCHSGVIDEVRAGHHVAIGLHDYPMSDDLGVKDFVANNVLQMRYFRSKSHYGGW